MRFRPDEESGEPEPDCAYSKLDERGYTGLLLWVVWRKTPGSLKHICNLVYPNTDITNKADPRCLKIAKIPASCKFPFASVMAKIPSLKSLKNHSIRVTSFGKFAILKRKRRNTPRLTTSRMVGSAKRYVARFRMRL